MEIAINKRELLSLVSNQLKNIFFLSANETIFLNKCIDNALERCEICFSKSTNRYYNGLDGVFFNPFHSGQYSIFLYFLSNEVFRAKSPPPLLADRIYYLNKTLNNLDLFYEVEMPEIFFLDHPVGTVIGRAKFGNGFSFSQNCTVGNNKGIYPIIGKNVKMMSGAKILGNCQIGDNVVISSNTLILDQDIPDKSIVFKHNDELIIKSKEISYFEKFEGR